MLRKQLLNISKVDWVDHTGRYPLLYNCNFYLGCIHNCKYCYSRMMMKRFGKKTDWTNVESVENAEQLIKKEAFKKAPGRIMFCSTTDPYQQLERETGLARLVLGVLLDSPHHTLITTKSDLVSRDFDIMQGHDNVELGLTITALRDIPEWEPRVPGIERRIKVLKRAHDLGIKTFVSMEPWIPKVTEPLKIIKELQPWVDRWIIGTLNYMGVNYEFYRYQIPLLLRYVEENQLKVIWKKELAKFLR